MVTSTVIKMHIKHLVDYNATSYHCGNSITRLDGCDSVSDDFKIYSQSEHQE